MKYINNSESVVSISFDIHGTGKRVPVVVQPKETVEIHDKFNVSLVKCEAPQLDPVEVQSEEVLEVKPKAKKAKNVQ